MVTRVNVYFLGLGAEVSFVKEEADSARGLESRL